MCVRASFRCYSDEDLSKLGVSPPSSVTRSPMHAASSPLHTMSPPSLLQDAMSRHFSSRTTNVQSDDLSMASVLESVKNSRRVLRSQMDEVNELKVCVVYCSFFVTLFTIVCLRDVVLLVWHRTCDL